MSLPIKSTVRKLPVDENGVLPLLNREVTPTVIETRDAVNARHGRYKRYEASATVDPRDEFIFADATDGPITITLPSAATWTRRIVVAKVDASANAVTVTAATDETVAGSASQTLDAQWRSVDLLSNGTDAFLVTSGVFALPVPDDTRKRTLIWDGTTWVPKNHRIVPFDTTYDPIGLWQLQNINAVDVSIPGALDTSGNGLHLTVEAGTDRYTQMVPTVAGFMFDGSTNLYRSTYSSILAGAKSFVWFMMIDPGNTTARLPVISQWAAGETENTNAQFEVACVRTSGVNTMDYFHEHGAGTNATFTLDAGPPTGVFAMMGYSYNDDNTVQFYMGGTLYGPASSTLTAPTGGTNTLFRYGGGSGASVTRYYGLLGPLVAFDFPLTNAQHCELYNRTLGGVYGYKTSA